MVSIHCTGGTNKEGTEEKFAKNTDRRTVSRPALTAVYATDQPKAQFCRKLCAGELSTSQPAVVHGSVVVPQLAVTAPH